MQTAPEGRAWSRIPGPIWALGMVSLLMDTSSELIHSVLPVFLTTSLGATVLTIGWLEGMAEATASFAKIFSGVVSDAIQKRKFLVVLGYSLAAFTKPLFPLASNVHAVFAARFLDRVGKGIRGAPRDALIAEIAPADLRGTCFGLRQALDTVGACLGPLLALLFLKFLGELRQVLWVGVLPAILAVFLLIFFVQEPKSSTSLPRKGAVAWQGAFLLPREFWLLCFISWIYTLSRVSEAFLLLKAQDIGMSLGLIPLVMVVMNGAYAMSAYPAGAISDRSGRHGMLIIGLLLLFIADSLLAFVSSLWGILGSCCLWGAHMGFTQGVFAAMVADAVPLVAGQKKMQGTAFGVFYFSSGIAALLSGAGAGFLWSRYGAASTFLSSAALSLFALYGVGQFEKRAKCLASVKGENSRDS